MDPPPPPCTPSRLLLPLLPPLPLLLLLPALPSRLLSLLFAVAIAAFVTAVAAAHALARTRGGRSPRADGGCIGVETPRKRSQARQPPTRSAMRGALGLQVASHGRGGRGGCAGGLTRSKGGGGGGGGEEDEKDHIEGRHLWGVRGVVVSTCMQGRG